MTHKEPAARMTAQNSPPTRTLSIFLIIGVVWSSWLAIIAVKISFTLAKILAGPIWTAWLALTVLFVSISIIDGPGRPNISSQNASDA